MRPAAAAEFRVAQRLAAADASASRVPSRAFGFAATAVAAAFAPTATALCAEGAAADAPAAPSTASAGRNVKPAAVVFVLGGPGAGKGTQAPTSSRISALRISARATCFART